MKPIRKAVFPVAGLGTRFLPATKAMPKEMLTVVDRPLDESDLIERAKRGDSAAYEALVRAHQGIAFRTAYVIAGNASDAEEAAQDGFVKA